MTRQVRFLLLDDLDHVRDSLRAVIELDSAWRVVDAAAEGEAGLRLAGRLAPDIVVLDAELPNTDIDALVVALKALPHAPRIVLMTIHEAPELSAETWAAIDLSIAKDTGAAGMLRALAALLGASSAPACAS